MKQLTLFLLSILFLITLNSYGQPNARVQIIHNSADVSLDTVDMWLNGNKEFDDLAFREATPFVDLPADTALNIGIAGQSSSAVGDTIVNFTDTLTNNETYVIVVHGVANPSNYSPSPDLTLAIKPMAREEANVSGNSDILIHHGSTDAPAIDIDETASGLGNLVNNLNYGQFGGYYELLPQDYVLSVKDSTGSPTIGVYEANLDQNSWQDSAITILASGFLDTSQNNNGPEFGLYAALAEGGQLIELPEKDQSARAQIIHNSADAALDTVDIWVNGNKAFDDLAFREATPFVDLPAATPLDIGIAGPRPLISTLRQWHVRKQIVAGILMFS
ncbi:MAG: hypothetical protein BRD50_06850 [Bacteroidetes bacterium SW_11_45_7]|nr:MAG: hypothetical protein BRD50_06850 [Bacteroidetes bacterium SW_11_45_7]